MHRWGDSYLDDIQNLQFYLVPNCHNLSTDLITVFVFAPGPFPPNNLGACKTFLNKNYPGTSYSQPLSFTRIKELLSLESYIAIIPSISLKKLILTKSGKRVEFKTS